ncbi:MAG: hypothetical protein WA030_04345 [Candidatus Microsaccharimonas sp.]
MTDTQETKVERILQSIVTQLGAMNGRFEQIDKHFKQIDRRFEAMDKHFKKIDRHFEQIDKRFEAMDKRFEQIDKRFEENDVKLNVVLDAIADVHDELRALISLNTQIITNHERKITSLERFIKRSA